MMLSNLILLPCLGPLLLGTNEGMHNKSQQNADYGGGFCCYIVWIFDEIEAATRSVLYKNVFLEISQN